MANELFRGTSTECLEHCRAGLKVLYKHKGLEANPKKSLGCLAGALIISTGGLWLFGLMGTGGFKYHELIWPLVCLGLGVGLVALTKDSSSPQDIPDGTRFRMWEIFFDTVAKEFPTAKFEFSPWDTSAEGTCDESKFELKLRTELLGTETESFTGYHETRKVGVSDYDQQRHNLSEITETKMDWKTSTTTHKHRRHRMIFSLEPLSSDLLDAADQRPSEYTRVDRVGEEGGRTLVEIVLKGWMKDALGHNREGQPSVNDLNIKSTLESGHHPDFVGENLAAAFLWVLGKRG